jgi:hypothetical protein
MRAPRIALVMEFESHRQFCSDHTAVSLGMAPTAERVRARARLREPFSIGSGAERGFERLTSPEPCVSDRNRKPAR